MALPMREITTKETAWFCRCGKPAIIAKGLGFMQQAICCMRQKFQVLPALVFIFCRGRGIPAPVVLPVLPPANQNPRDSVNQLSEGFIHSLQASLPSIVFTILRTASALAPFPWNDPTVANDACGATASASGKQKPTGACGATALAASQTQAPTAKAQGYCPPLCSLCSTPLSPAEIEAALAAAAAACQPAANIAEALRGSCCTSCQGQVLGRMKSPFAAVGTEGQASATGMGPVLPDFITERLEALKLGLAAAASQ